MIEATVLNTLLLSAVVIIAVIVFNHRYRKAVANYQAPLNSKSIVALLQRNGLLSSVVGPWIVFDYQGKEYTINASKLPILVVIKQTSLKEHQHNTTDLQEVAQSVSLDTAMAIIHIDGNPANRAIIQLNAIETCLGSFAQRLNIYLDIIEETETRFFDEIRRKKNQQLTGYLCQ
ncbi:MAG: hypothetical protein IJ151_07170 [Bacteroidales bacterium]|nr:hypothetical protein [Bacteroidales bacterium]